MAADNLGMFYVFFPHLDFCTPFLVTFLCIPSSLCTYTSNERKTMLYAWLITFDIASYGSLARYRSIERLYPVGQHTVIGASGDFSDFQYIKHVLDSLMLAKSLFCYLFSQLSWILLSLFCPPFFVANS